MIAICEICKELVDIVKADDEDFIRSLGFPVELEKTLLELYENGENEIIEILADQAREINQAIQNLSTEELEKMDMEGLEDFLFLLEKNAEYFNQNFELALISVFSQMYEVFGTYALQEISSTGTWEVLPKNQIEFTAKITKLIPDMNMHSVNRTVQFFKDAFKDGLTPQEKAQKLKELSADLETSDSSPFDLNRATRISRTFTTASANGGRLEGWNQSGIVKKKKWKAAKNERTRKSHKNANNQIVDIEQPFKIGDDFLMFPADPNGSAKEIVNCRCTMTAVFD